MYKKLIVALDVGDIKSAKKLINELAPVVDIFKVGMQLFTAYGPEIVKTVEKAGARVFLDLKLFDIPNTMINAIHEAQKLGVWAVTVHTMSGDEAMRKLAMVQPRPILLGVTVLTSFNDNDMDKIGINRSISEQVACLASMAQGAGLDGAIASGREIKTLRKVCGDDFIIITPGIRPMNVSDDDQKRVMTPNEAISKGADYIVVGRPIVHAGDPLKITKAILSEIGV